MKKSTINEKGFGAVELVLVVVVIALLVAASLLFFINHHKAASTATRTNTTQNTNTYTGWATCNDTTLSLMFRYPTNWASSGKVDNCGISGVNSELAGGQAFELQSPASNSAYVFVLSYNLCPNQQFSADPTTVLNVSTLQKNSNTPQFYLAALTSNKVSPRNVDYLYLTQDKYAVGQTVNSVNCIQIGSGNNAYYYYVSAYLTSKSEQYANINTYPMSEYESQTEYTNLVKIFESLSYN